MSVERGSEEQEDTVEDNAFSSRSITFSFVAITLIFFLTVVGFAWLINDVREISKNNTILIAENKKRIEEKDEILKAIQDSRVASCQKTYSGIKEVFTPFIPLPPRTSEQQENIDKFNATIEELQKGCIKQTKPKSESQS